MQKKTDTISKNIELISQYLFSKAKIIPGVPSIEIVPNNIEDYDSFFYAGPLIRDDYEHPFTIEKINTFLKINKLKKKIFITLGLVESIDISALIKVLIERDFAIFTTIFIEKFATYPNYFFLKFYPLNYICSRVDLVIHQCGSGIYQYPILNSKPSITIGTNCYDREDVALRLEELCLSQHLPSLEDFEGKRNNRIEYFNFLIDNFLSGKILNNSSLKIIQKEYQKISSEFNFDKVVQYCLK